MSSSDEDEQTIAEPEQEIGGDEEEEEGERGGEEGTEEEREGERDEEGDEAVKGKKLSPGVVYLSRIPPYMRPRKVRHLLSQYGRLGRVYLAPEDPATLSRRRRHKRNRRRKYREGWVEFMDKRVAKATALALNNTQIGGKKRYYYHDDIWNMKYLPKFRWHHLTEKIAYEQAVEEQKMRLEMSQVKRQTDKILENFEKSKELSAIIDRKKKTGRDLLQYTMRHFKQRKIVALPPPPSHSQPFSSSSSSSSADATGSEISDTLLKMIFPKRD